MPLITSHAKTYLVTIVSENKIKSNCEVLFPVRVKGIRCSTDVFLLEPLSSTPTNFGVLGVKYICQIEQGKTVYKVLNYRNSDVYIPTNKPIATASTSVKQICEDPDHSKPQLNTVDKHQETHQTYEQTSQQYIQKVKH